jgi:sugar lactone lactonase YvrE
MRRLLAIIVGIVVAAAWAHAAHASEAVVVAFDPNRGEFPEGIALDHHGAMYVGLAPLGEIRRRTPDGSWSSFASIDPGTSGLALLGLTTDARGTVYAAAPTDAPEWHGVVAISPQGSPRRLAGTEQIAFPNALAFDRRGNLYVTDSIGGAIWRLSRNGDVELWIDHEALAGTAVLNPFPLGANGIAYSRGRLYVANTEKMQVVEIPILPSGAAGTPSIIRKFPGPGDFLDGVGVDVVGNLYVLVAGTSELMRIDRTGHSTTVAGPDDGLSLPVSMVFGPRGHGRQTLYITNFSLPDFVPTPKPGVVAVNVPFPGPPAGHCPRR